MQELIKFLVSGVFFAKVKKTQNILKFLVGGCASILPLPIQARHYCSVVLFCAVVLCSFNTLIFTFIFCVLLFSYMYIPNKFKHGVSVCRDHISLAVLQLVENEALQKLYKKWWYDKGECQHSFHPYSSNRGQVSDVLSLFWLFYCRIYHCICRHVVCRKLFINKL